MPALLSNNFITHFIETRKSPQVPEPYQLLWEQRMSFVEREVANVIPVIVSLNQAFTLDNLRYEEYVELREKLRVYYDKLRGLLSPFHRCPPEVISEILLYTTPNVRLDDFPSTPFKTVPVIHCPQITVLARLSKTFRAIVYGTPALFSSIRLRRRHICQNFHHPKIAERLTRLITLSEACPLSVTIQFVTVGPYQPSSRTNVASPCATMMLLKSKAWASVEVVGEAFCVAQIARDQNVFPTSIAGILTTLMVSFPRALEHLVTALAQAAVPLVDLAVSISPDPITIPDLNHDVRLPSTLRHLHVTGSSRTALFYTRSASFVTNLSLTLRPGCNSVSGTPQEDFQIAPPSLCLRKRISLDSLTFLTITDEDVWNMAVPDVLSWVSTPSLVDLRIVWDIGNSYIENPYRTIVNEFITRTPSLRTIYGFNMPRRVSQPGPYDNPFTMHSPMPECTIRMFDNNLEADIQMAELPYSSYWGYQSDEDESDRESELSNASNGIVYVCSCPWRCPCYDRARPSRPRTPSETSGFSMEFNDSDND